MISDLFLLLILFIIALFVAVLLILRKLAEIKKIATPDETLKDWVKSSEQRSQSMSQEISQ
ncbi:MAG: hypothetical protein NT052_00095, partial [Candidatus Shapirobacteria bacterium]|nr:hypothetical protein [Candidatus Shapirobacteria bacterium]